jgi:hypothetical protein
MHADIPSLNGGLSSIEFALYSSSVAGLERKLFGKIDHTGMRTRSGRHYEQRMY